MPVRSEQKWDGRSRGGTFGTWCFVWLIRHAGLGAAYALLSLVVPYFVVFAPRATRSVWRFGRRVRRLGRWRSALEVFATYYAFGQCIIDKIAIGQGQTGAFTFATEGMEQVRSLFRQGDEGRSVAAVFVSGHVGSWEAATPLFAHFGKRMNVTIFDNEDEDVRRVIERKQRGRPFNLIPLRRDGLESVMEIKAALDRGEFVCFMGDRFMTGASARRLPFMGHEACFPDGPFDICASMRVPMAFFFVVREPRRTYRAHFVVLPRGEGGRADPRAMQRAFVTELERIVWRHPRQWFNFYEYFN